jgi:sigma-E factor negative regulatory protein RseB
MRTRAVSLIMVLLCTAAPAAMAASSAEARAWIERMNKAVVNLNYDGVVEHYWKGGGHETLRVIHRMKDNQISERVVIFGSRNEIIRKGSKFIEYDRRSRIAKAQTLNRSFGYLSAFNGISAESDKLYDIRSGGQSRLKDYPGQVQLISVQPLDEKRYGYRFWLDTQSAMPIKTQLVSANKEVLDEITFVVLSLPETIDDEKLEPALDQKSFKWMRPIDTNLEAREAFAPRASLLPEGFRELKLPPASEAEAKAFRTRFIVSDGIAWVSVFVSVTKPPFVGSRQASASGAYMFVTGLEGHYITVVGEVPPATVQRIAEAIRPE